MSDQLQKVIEDAVDDLRLLIAEQKCAESQHSKRLMGRLKRLSAVLARGPREVAEALHEHGVVLIGDRDEATEIIDGVLSNLMATVDNKA